MRLQARRIDGFILLDDSYNANADSMQAALDTLARYPCSGRRVAVLGDMAELGAEAEQAHEEVGAWAAGKKVDCLITIGERSRTTAAAARAAGLGTVENFSELAPAMRVLRNSVRPNDVVLVKASRSSRFERVVEELRRYFETAPPRETETPAEAG
jgi:UDP-N-acetylmuramoyl-tripeptide--D-alanyl-D-alanine ligase